MSMKQRMTTVLAALTLGVAGAQTTAPATGTSLPGTLPASVTRTQADALAAFLKAGGQVQLLNADGAVIGTLNADGTVTLAGRATLADARKVQVVPATGQGEPTTYTLARDLSKPGAIKFQVMGPNGKMLSLPLSAVVNRQAGMKMKAGGEAEARSTEEEQGGKTEKAAKPQAKPQKEKAENPGKGKGKGK